jgi:hypothetical protein
VNLELHARVISRYRTLLALGLVLAFVLAFLSMYKVSLFDISSRSSTVWTARSEVLVSQEGFPWGRSVDELLPGNPATGLPARTAADIDRLTRLSVLYAQLANSDPVRRILARSGPVRGSIQATPVFAFVNQAENATSFTLPLIRLTATARSSSAAIALSRRSAEALSAYITQQQTKAGIPPRQRAQVEIVRRARGAGALSSSSRFLPVFVFLATVLGVLGLVYVFENRRQSRSVSTPEDVAVPAPDAALPPVRVAAVPDGAPSSDRWA